MKTCACQDCNGYGMLAANNCSSGDPGLEEITCPTCNGDGEVSEGTESHFAKQESERRFRERCLREAFADCGGSGCVPAPPALQEIHAAPSFDLAGYANALLRTIGRVA